MSVTEEIEELLEGKRFAEASKRLPTELCHLKALVGDMHGRSCMLSICWLNTLLRNPFDLRKILTSEEYGDLEHFLFGQLDRPLHPALRKMLVADIALLVNNEVDAFSQSDGKFFIRHRPVCENDFYGILTQLSKIVEPGSMVSENNKILFELRSDNSVNVSRYKIKIRSHLSGYDTAKDDIKYALGFINYDDVRFGWTLSKAIFRISRFLNRESVMESIVALLQSEIFGDEQRWINCLTVVGLFLLNGGSLADISFVRRALTHDREFVFKSANLRETALFLIWVAVRCNSAACNDQELMNAVVSMSLFDQALNCRRAAATVIGEFIGRNGE